jgi:competence protein ComGC
LRNRIIGIRGESGFTIIETLIALSLMVMAIIPLAMFLTVGLKTSLDAGVQMYAREIASSEIDKVKSLQFDAVGLSGVTTYYATATNNQQVRQENGYLVGLVPHQVIQNGNTTYTVDRDVRKVNVTSKTNVASMKRVTIKVTWTQPLPGGTVELSTLLGRTDMSGT